MAIKLTSTKQAAADNGIKVLVHGPAGSGKTVLCGTTDAPTVIISAEAGLLSLRDKDIPVIEVKSIDDVHEAYRFVSESAEGQQFSWVCLDSISEIGEVCLAAEKKKAKDPRQAYGALAERMGEMVRAFRDLPGRNVYFSSKQERQKVTVMQPVKKGAVGLQEVVEERDFFQPSMPGSTLKQGIGYFFDEVMALRVETTPEGAPYRVLQTGRDAFYEAKDRSGVLDMYEPPSLAHIHTKIVGTPF